MLITANFYDTNDIVKNLQNAYDLILQLYFAPQDTDNDRVYDSLCSINIIKESFIGAQESNILPYLD